MSKKKVVEALKMLRVNSPTFFEEVIENGACPHDAGLKAVNKDVCGYEDTERVFELGHCGQCWADALGDNDG